MFLDANRYREGYEARIFRLQNTQLGKVDVLRGKIERRYVSLVCSEAKNKKTKND